MSENHHKEAVQTQQPVATRTRRLSNTSNLSTTIPQVPLKSKRIKDKKTKLDKKDASNISGRLRKSISVDQIVDILKKDKSERDKEEVKVLDEWSFLIPEAEARMRAKLAKSVLKERAVEYEESNETIEKKANILAQLIREAKYIVIYTGAGISTSASIPDYRGPNGLWTQIKKTGTFSITKIYDLSTAGPTLTHMAINELCKRKVVNHVVSQNCDGLHLRSGIPQTNLSEIHGNMYIEVCPTCEKQYFRQADITERTSRFRHKTGRTCHTCAEPNNNLIDTIVLYGERSRTQWPMNWERASKAAKKADLIICMGSSLKTLRRYNCLWPKGINGSGNKEPETKLAIINLQYTPKDKNAVLKINGRCDLVMQLVMQRLNIDVPTYDSSLDPLHHLATPFTPEERADLKTNLIFESKVRQSSASPTPSKRSASELCSSPSLFVSEITDDPEKKKLKMRIRVKNTGTASPDDLQPDQEIVREGGETAVLKEEETEKPVLHDKGEFALPGWLGKSLGTSRTSSYRRKRHGNKGRKHSSTIKTPHVEDNIIESKEEVDPSCEHSNKTCLDSDKHPQNQKLSPSDTLITNNSKNATSSPINLFGCPIHLSEIMPAVLNEPMKAIKQET